MILNESVTNKDEQLKEWIKEWLKKYIRQEGVHNSIIIDSNGLVSINGDFSFRSSRRKKIPVQFLKCTGDFVTSIFLITLNGSPKFVGGNFYCDGNKNLTNLKSGPEEVGDTYACSDCSTLTSLEGAPKFVGGDFYCAKCNNLPYSELFKIVDAIKGNIYYSSILIPEDKDAIRRKRDIHMNLQHDELGNLDI